MRREGCKCLGRVEQDGPITEFFLEELSQYPTGITAGLDGNLWFTNFFGNAVGVIITVGPDRNIWFVDTSGNKIGRWEYDRSAPGGGGGHDPAAVPLLVGSAPQVLNPLPPVSGQFAPQAPLGAPAPISPLAVEWWEVAADADRAGEWLSFDPLLWGIDGLGP